MLDLLLFVCGHARVQARRGLARRPMRFPAAALPGRRPGVTAGTPGRHSFAKANAAESFSEFADQGSDYNIGLTSEADADQGSDYNIGLTSEADVGFIRSCRARFESSIRGPSTTF
jgi:hypothetical protein